MFRQDLDGDLRKPLRGQVDVNAAARDPGQLLGDYPSGSEQGRRDGIGDRLVGHRLEAIGDDGDVHVGQILLANRLRQEQQAVETQVELVVQRRPGRSVAYRPQVHDLARGRVSAGQVGEQRVVVLAHAGANRILPAAAALVGVAGGDLDHLVGRPLHLDRDLVPSPGEAASHAHYGDPRTLHEDAS